MKTYYVLLVVFLLSIAPYSAYAQVNAVKPPAEEKPYEKAARENNFSMEYFVFFAPGFNNDVVSSDILAGNIVVYISGNTLCAPCLGFGKAATDAKLNKYKDTPNLKFVYITTDEAKDIKRLATTPDIKYDYIVPMTFDKMIDIGYIMEYKPTYILVDKTGRVVAKGFGSSHIVDQAKKTFNDKIGVEIDKLLLTDGFSKSIENDANVKFEISRNRRYRRKGYSRIILTYFKSPTK